MNIKEMNWMQLEEYLKQDDRAILPIGSVEQHAYLSLCTDAILAEKIAQDAAFSLQIPVFPILYYGMTPHLKAFPGAISLKIPLYMELIQNILEEIIRNGFHRVLVVNGHGGNNAICEVTSEVMANHPDVKIKFHNWWDGPKTWELIQAIDPVATHASWLENFPWTRLCNVIFPKHPKKAYNPDAIQLINGKDLRSVLGDGSFGGVYEHSDEDMLEIWETAVKEIQESLENWY
ncbi:MAG: creatininase family protein [Candidatus Brocadiae bacterium]|nr:creatininase family protein [Candidatus Brocadiia bacterium]